MWNTCGKHKSLDGKIFIACPNIVFKDLVYSPCFSLADISEKIIKSLMWFSSFIERMKPAVNFSSSYDLIITSSVTFLCLDVEALYLHLCYHHAVVWWFTNGEVLLWFFWAHEWNTFFEWMESLNHFLKIFEHWMCLEISFCGILDSIS